MKRDHGNQKVAFISGLLFATLVLIGWYLYETQQTKIRSITDESHAKQQLLSNDLSQAKKEIGLLNMRIHKLTQDQSALQGSLVEEQKLRYQLQTKIQSITDESQAKQQLLSNDLSQAKKEIGLLNTRIHKLTQDQSALQGRLVEEQKLRYQLQTKLEQAEANKIQMEQGMQQEVKRITSVTAELEMELQQRLSQQKTLNDKIDMVSDDKSQLVVQLETEREKRRQLRQKIAQVTDNVEQKENALTDSEQDVSRLNLQLTKTRDEQYLLKNRIEKLNQQRQIDFQHFAELEERLEQELNEGRFEITQLKNRMMVIKLTSEVLFNSGSAQIKPAGQKVLTLIAESLNAYPDRAISIEGHTDNNPIGGNSRYASNWELSTARALAAVNYFQENNQVNPNRLKIVGHGEYDPVSSNETVEGRKRNRRIEIRVLPESVVSVEE
jgi:chemotaxis protein MotB